MQWQYIDIREMTEGEYQSWYAVADEFRRAKCGVCRVSDDRLRSVAADHLARICIARRCGVNPDRIRFGRTGDGKPYALDLDVHFNLSHSGNFVVCAVADRPVGIDVEQIRPIHSRLTKKVCTEAELAWIRDAAGWGEKLTGEAMIRFFRVWTSKEAYFKGVGTGITDLKSVDTLDHIHSHGTFELEGHMVSIYEA